MATTEPMNENFRIWVTPDILMKNITGQFKKKVTLSRVYNEVTSEPTITQQLLGKLSKFICN
jgi:hypothetical protein